jgi:hypothetical protein
MWLKLVRISLFFLLIFVCYTCQKENGKNEYSLIFYYDNGIIEKYENTLIYEQRRNHIDRYGNIVNNKSYTNGLLVDTGMGSRRFVFLKTDTDFLACCGSYYTKMVMGNIEMYGKYKRKGRSIIVNDGTFTISWKDSVQTNTLLGTWTLTPNKY